MGWSLLLSKSRFYAFSMNLSSFMSIFFSLIPELLIVTFSLQLVWFTFLILSGVNLDIPLQFKNGLLKKTEPDLAVKLEGAASPWVTL